MSQQQSTGLVDHHYTVLTSLSNLNWHSLMMVFVGDNVKVYVDGLLYLDVTDSIIGVLGVSQVELASWGDSESQFGGTTITF